jgi:hypothetical protein
MKFKASHFSWIQIISQENANVTEQQTFFNFNATCAQVHEHAQFACLKENSLAAASFRSGHPFRPLW